MSVSRRDIIIATVSDLVSEFVNNGRREDEELPRGAILEAIVEGEITEEEIVQTFAEFLKAEL